MPTWLCSACLTRALTLELPGKGYTHVSGAHQTDDGSHNTLVTSTVEGLNLLDVVTADRIVARNVMFFRQSLEHSIWGPLGFSIMAEECKVGLTRGDLGSNPWIHSFASGLTLRAGGFPQVFLLFAWGGNEGTHTIANVNTSLLGGSGRPSLF